MINYKHDKLDLTYLRMTQEKNRLRRKQNEVALRNEVAEKYTNYCEKKRKAKELEERNARAYQYSNFVRINTRTEKAKEIIGNLCLLLGCIAIIGIFVYIGVTFGTPEERYPIASDNGNGLHYEYVTERTCEVVEVEDTLITVSYKGNEYAFYGTNYEVGDEIICQFTDGMEIVGVVE